MNTSILTSTFALTLLLAIGLVFFIRASTKDRIESVQLVIEGESAQAIASQVQEYFAHRSYRLAAVDADNSQVTFIGNVQASLFMAIFLSSLAGVGLLCLTLMAAIVVPDFLPWGGSIVSFAPAAGIFYWQRAGRQEQVRLGIEPLGPISGGWTRYELTVVGHRDELAVLQQTLPLKYTQHLGSSQ